MPSPFTLYRQQYPDPFLDVASTKLPKNRKKLLELLFQFATTHPQIRPIVKKLSKYPITQVVVSSNKPGHEALEKRWIDTLEWNLNIYQIAEEAGLDFMGYGNAFLTVHKPFTRSYVCQGCKQEHPAGEVKYYITGKKFMADCKSCKGRHEMMGRDRQIDAVDEIAIVRIPPKDIYIRHNELTNTSEYYRNVPKGLIKAISKGSKPDRTYLNNTPWVYIQAALHKKKIKFAKNKVLHLKEPSLSGYDDSWGLPIIMGALRDAYLLQIYKKADESVANERAVPARFIYPQATSQDPLRTISLSKFSSFMNSSIRRYRHDKNAIMPVPFPVGVAEIGGDAQRLTTAPLREIAIREIIGSTGVPEGFLGDGMTWSGGSVQLRMLENMIMAYMRSLNRLLSFVVREVAKITDWPTVDIKFKPFRMTDDIQTLQILVQLYQMKIVSAKELLDRLDMNFDEQHDLIKRESRKIGDLTVEEALLEAKAALRSVSYQMEAQSQQGSYGELLEQINNAADATVSHFQRENTYEGAKMENAQAQQQQAEAEQQMTQTQMEYTQAQTANLQAEAQKDQTLAGGGMQGQEEGQQQQQAVPPLVEKMARGLLAESPQQRKKSLEKLYQNAPDIAQQVEEVLSGLLQEGGGEQQQQGGQEDIIGPLKAEAKDPEDLANKILMLPAELKQVAFDQLIQQDTQLAQIVASFISSMSARRKGHQNMKKADDRAMPEAKPPRRK